MSEQLFFDLEAPSTTTHGGLVLTAEQDTEVDHLVDSGTETYGTALIRVGALPVQQTVKQIPLIDDAWETTPNRPANPSQLHIELFPNAVSIDLLERSAAFDNALGALARERSLRDDVHLSTSVEGRAQLREEHGSNYKQYITGAKRAISEEMKHSRKHFHAMYGTEKMKASPDSTPEDAEVEAFSAQIAFRQKYFGQGKNEPARKAADIAREEELRRLSA